MSAAQSGTLVLDRPHIRIRGRPVPVVLPRRGDPRLKLAAVIVTLQVLGQTVLEFKLSIAQILITIGVCAVVDVLATYRREHMLVWPASAMLTGNSVAFILRASGTDHGDWWSLNGIEFFVLAAAISLASKYFVRPRGKHIFNPSNVGLVWTLLVIGPTQVFPQYLWWGPVGVPVGLALGVILAGAVWILRSVRMVPMALSFLVPFSVLMAVFALMGRSFFAIWHTGPIDGLSYWATICASPEVLVFVFFMMSDPQTAPRDPLGRIVYGAGTAVVAAALIYPQTTEFGIKLGILASLTVTCALVPFIERAVQRYRARAETAADGRGPSATGPKRTRPSLANLRNPVIAAAAIISLAAPVNTLALAGNKQILYIEKGLTGPVSPQ